jgi:hypothetical protein
VAWLLAEDRALKLKLQGIKVTDTNAPVGGRPVAVRYWEPETERSPLTFPIIMIRHTDIQKDEEREHRGRIDLGYSPEGFDPVTITNGNAYYQSKIYAEFPIPYNLDYQVSVLSRNSQHDIQLRGIMLQTQYLPTRFGFLEIPEDGTVRSLYVLGSVSDDDATDADGKRLFSTNYVVRIATELVEGAHLIDQVQQVIMGVSTLPEEYS